MAIVPVIARRVGLTLCLAVLAGCSSGGALGNILGSVLGSGGSQSQGNQVAGIINGVDGRSRQLGIQQSNGQTVVIAYDNQTQVVYQNRTYSVSSLENGDEVTARIQSSGNGYYTDLVQVNRSVSSAGGRAGNVQSLQGTVRQVDQGNGMFALDANDGARLVVSLPSGLTRADLDRFRNLRAGDYVRLYGVYITRSRVELRQFY